MKDWENKHRSFLHLPIFCKQFLTIFELTFFIFCTYFNKIMSAIFYTLSQHCTFTSNCLCILGWKKLGLICTKTISTDVCSGLGWFIKFYLPCKFCLTWHHLGWTWSWFVGTVYTPGLHELDWLHKPQNTLACDILKL